MPASGAAFRWVSPEDLRAARAALISLPSGGASGRSVMRRASHNYALRVHLPGTRGDSRMPAWAARTRARSARRHTNGRAVSVQFARVACPTRNYTLLSPYDLPHQTEQAPPGAGSGHMGAGEGGTHQAGPRRPDRHLRAADGRDRVRLAQRHPGQPRQDRRGAELSDCRPGAEALRGRGRGLGGGGRGMTSPELAYAEIRNGTRPERESATMR